MPGVKLGMLSRRYFENERPIGIVLEAEEVDAQALAAAVMYSGYGGLSSLLPSGHDGVIGEGAASIQLATEINASEWAVIRPLFVLYVERENAIRLESSRGLGVDVFGRSTSEIASDIALMEGDLPKKAFRQPVVTV